MVGSQAGYINLLCFPGELSRLTVESLSMLLAANRYQEEDPAISISLLDDASPSRVVLWSRIGLAAADADRLGALFLRFVETAHATRTWLHAGAPGVESGKPRTSKPTSTADWFTVMHGKSAIQPMGS